MSGREIDILARTVWGEARGEGDAGMEAVACVVMNRLAVARGNSGGYWWGNTAIQICQARMQFSCWNGNDPNLKKLLAVTGADPQFADALKISAKALSGNLLDATHGATHYVAAGAHADWAAREKPVAVIGHHIFYQLVPVPKPEQVPTATPTPTEKENTMSDFTDKRNRFEHWLSSGLHSLWESLSPGLVRGGEQLAKQVYHDIASAQQNGAQGKDLVKAGLGSLEKNAVTVGVNVAMEEVVPAIGAMVAHVVQDAPPPPAN